MFIDEAKIHIKAGNGGNGCLSFRREKYVAKGGPDGGDGGRGASIFFQAAENVDTLLDFAGKHHWRAGNGGDGQGSNKHGHDGEDLIIQVPPGTLVYDEEFDIMLKDMDKIGMKVCICKGGKGGRGNRSFASATNQTPRSTTLGRQGQERNLRLELKLLGDVGLLGKPNAGKSTLVSRCSQARPKIADYPFTTLEPVLGIVELSGFRRFVMADIPGIIEGAHTGAGLGLEFLKHIERTAILAHVIDIMPTDNSEPIDNYNAIRAELEKYSEKLAQKPEIIIANKADLDPDGDFINDFQQKIGKPIFAISAVTGQGLEELIENLWKLVKTTRGQISTQ